MGNVLKWGAILVVAYIAWRWIANSFNGGGGVVGSGNFSLLNAPYAAPIAPPYGVVGWAAPWQYAGAGITYGGRPRRFRR